MNIAVLAGGISTERQVSLSSGTMVCNALRKQGHNAVLIDVFFGIDSLPDNIMDIFSPDAANDSVQIFEDEPDLDKIRAMRTGEETGDIGKNVLEVCKAADIVYMGLHGENGENGRMQAFFDVLNIKYTGSGYLASALAMNKWITKQLLLQNGICTANGAVLIKGRELPHMEFHYPCIVKPCSGGSSIGVFVVNNDEELFEKIAHCFQYENEILVEEFIKGREFSVGVLGDTVLPAIEIIPRGGFYDYSHKYQAGWTEEICPANITENEAALLAKSALDVYTTLGLEVYSRIDFIIANDGKAYCLEANTLPGMTPTSLLPQEAAAIGISYEELCEKIIALSLEKYR